MGTAARTMSKRSGRIVLVLTLVVVAVPLLVAMPVAASGSDLPPNDDVALIELRTADVGPHTPLVGSYERFGGSQPGPLLFYLLAAPYRLAGSTFTGLAVGALAITLVCVWVVVWIAFRRGQAVLGLWTALGIEVLLLGRGAESLRSPWEPLVLLPVFLLLVFLVWELAGGTWWAMPGIALAASFLLQAWIAYGLLVVLLGGLAAGIGAVRLVRGARSGHGVGGAPGPLVATGVLLLVVWLPPVAEQVAHEPGNLVELASLRDQDGPRVGLLDGARAVAIEFDLWAPWLGEPIPTVPFSHSVSASAHGAVPVGLLVFVGAAILAWRRKARDATWLNVIVGVTVLGAIASKALVIDELHVWIVEPDRVIGLSCWLAAGYSLLRSLSAPAGMRVARAAVPVLGVALVATAGALTWRVVAEPNDAGVVAEAVDELAAEALASSDLADSPVFVRSDASLDEPGYQACCQPILAAILERAGVDVVVERSNANRFGEHRAEASRARTELRLVSADDAARLERFGYELVGVRDLLTGSQRAEREAILRRLATIVGDDPTLEQIAAEAVEDPRVPRLYRDLERFPGLPKLALLRRSINRASSTSDTLR